MAITKLTRPNQTWAIALASAFANPAAPSIAELNERRFVHFVSCALTEDNTSMTLGDSDTDSTVTFCSIGNESTPTFANPTAQFTSLLDQNTGGSGSTVNLLSLYNKVEAMLGDADIPYILISRTGPNASQDIAFAAGQYIKMMGVTTDIPVYGTDNGSPATLSQSFLYSGTVLNWNYKIV